MVSESPESTLTYSARLDAIRATKMAQTREKQRIIGAMDYDDWALVLPPPDRRKIVQTISGSGVPITDCLLDGFAPAPNHPSGGFFGPRAVGAAFRGLLEAHPVYIDPLSSLAGAYMVNFNSYRKPQWNPDLDYSHLHADQQRYGLAPAIGGVQHFCQDMEIGLRLGWGGLQHKIDHYRDRNATRASDFYAGLGDVVAGMQRWIGRHAIAARRMAAEETDATLSANLLEIAAINDWILTEPPRTFREALQWILWFQSAARMYNGSGSLGRLDVMLGPYYQRDAAAGVLTDEEAIFHLACYLVRDTAYIQLGGPDPDGRDVTNPVSYLALEAAHRLKVPANIGVCVGESTDPGLLRRGVELLFEDRAGIPKFLGIDRTTEGFARNGYPLELARQRAYSGCHWSALPGREYTLNDGPKINFASVFDVALRAMMADAARGAVEPSVADLWGRFRSHLRRAVDVLAEGLDFHYAHMPEVFPELVLDLLSHGPIERGIDASGGGVEYYNMCIDGAALATVADSFAAVEQRVEHERRLTWEALIGHLDADFAGPEGERVRLMLRNIPRFGAGGSRADDWAVRITRAFTEIVKERPTPGGLNLIPGLFAWALTIAMGKEVGATPNGRRAGEPISHGANPEPGFRKDGAPTALAAAVASVQPGYGNTAPMQIEFSPSLGKDNGEGIENVISLIRSHFDMGGTQININVMDAARVLEAHKHPDRYPDLVVRVTGYSAFFHTLSPEYRQQVVDRILAEE